MLLLYQSNHRPYSYWFKLEINWDPSDINDGNFLSRNSADHANRVIAFSNQSDYLIRQTKFDFNSSSMNVMREIWLAKVDITDRSHMQKRKTLSVKYIRVLIDRSIKRTHGLSPIRQPQLFSKTLLNKSKETFHQFRFYNKLNFLRISNKFFPDRMCIWPQGALFVLQLTLSLLCSIL